MEKNNLSRQYLESDSTMDLINLANEYGIDIPDNLDRRFIIEELLDVASEINNNKEITDDVLEDKALKVSRELPSSYNETRISVILRNPVWAYVFWDIKESLLHEAKDDPDFEYFSLRVTLYNDDKDEKSTDFFDVQLQSEDREQFILIPSDKKAFVVHLLYNSEGQSPKVLSTSRKVILPAKCASLSDIQPGKKIEMSDLTELSGMKELLYQQYNEHRQLFS